LQNRVDAGEAVGHEADQRPIAQSDDVGLVRRSTLLVRFDDLNAVEQSARLVGGKGRGLPFLTKYFGPRTAWAGLTSMI
jgi:hypothetical protein